MAKEEDRIETFIVRVSVPPKLSNTYVRTYIEEAVTMWSGQFSSKSSAFYFCNPEFGKVCTVLHVPIKKR